MGDTVKERPILFSSPMVRAILAGTKTQTRRLAKFIPLTDNVNLGFSGLSPGQYNTGDLSSGAVLYSRGAGGAWNQRTKPLRYYALPGDRLWVRESWNVSGLAWGNKPSEAAKIAAPSAWRYAATDEGSWQHGWRPSIHMPRTASRITLEVTGVRVERLQAITEDDARAEGVETSFDGRLTTDGKSSPSTIHTFGPDAHVKSFALLWDAINGDRATWASNPWVWVIAFRRVQP